MTMEEPGADAKAEQAEKLKKHFGHCFEILQIDDGDRIPVGGRSIYSSEADIKVTGDFESFQNFFDEAQELSGKYNLEELKKWLSSQGFEIDEELFASLYAFTKTFEEHFPDNGQGTEARKELYKDADKNVKLSEVFNEKSAECAEIASLAQVYLQRAGVPSTYFSGDVLWNRGQEFSGEHSFIIVRHEGKVYIFDPTNPVNTSAGKFPSVYTTEADFDEEMDKRVRRFVTAKNILSKKEAFFGANNGTDVQAERDIV